MNQKRRYPREFKLNILREIETKKMAEVCRANNISSSTVCGWKKDYASNPKEAFKGNGNVWKEDAKITQYERIIGRQTVEIEFLKKTCETLKQHLEEERMKERCDIK